nr:SDR family oxidoreductase [Actinomycetota bacterium]
VQGRGCDVTDERAVAGLADWILAEHGRLDVLVTSAGVQARGGDLHGAVAPGQRPSATPP